MRYQRLARAIPACLAAVVLAGCEGVQSALDPAGPQAALIGAEMIYLVAMASAVFALVAGALAVALLRRRGGDETPRAWNHPLASWVAAASVVTAIVLIANLVIDMRTDHALGRIARDGAVEIEVTGRQWWWELEYQSADPSRQLTTANELHIPAGEPVLLTLRSADVIHSFWVPQFHGKRDLIPGYTRELWVQANEPGTYRGSCAEFCGHQHAHMGLVVVAETRADFDRWYNAQLAPAASKDSDAEGAAVFAHKACPVCHAIRGTDAAARLGPDLTHFGSRSTIGAATLANGRAELASWLLDPHGAKPGVKMPPNDLTAAELDSLLGYLQGLR
jgi:cytochrome c oxidase subunit 2